MRTVIATTKDAGRIHRFAKNVDPEWRCNVPAMESGKLERTYPSQHVIEQFIQRDDTSVIMAMDGRKLVGFIIGVDDAERRHGGCHGRWMAISPVDRGYITIVMFTLFESLCSTYGWVWGRITHPILQDILLGNPNVECIGKDVFAYKRPQ